MKKSKETQGKKKLNKKMVIAAAGLLFTCGGLVACGTADTPKEYVVTMQSETDGFVSYSITVKEGVTISEIKNQIRSIDGYTLEGVYKDQACQQPYADTDVISANTTVYLKFNKDLDPEMLAKLSFTFVTDHYEVEAAYESIEGEVVIPGTYNDGENGLHPVTIPDGTYLTGAFANCENITSVEIGEGITSIGSHAFYDCINLTSITIPSSVNNIVNDAFSGCDKLTEVINKSSLQDNQLGDADDYALRIIKDEAQKGTFEDIGYVTYYKYDNEVVAVGTTTYRIYEVIELESNTTAIKSSAFNGDYGGLNVKINADTHIKTVGKSAFFYRNNLIIDSAEFYNLLTLDMLSFSAKGSIKVLKIVYDSNSRNSLFNNREFQKAADEDAYYVWDYNLDV